jgi:transcription antitermination protein NusB
MGRRTKARECAFQMLYQWDLTRAPLPEVIDSFWRLRTTTERTMGRVGELLQGTHRHLEAIDRAIAEAATHWRLDRIATVDRNILRLATYELLCEPGTPASVIIDEAVEMAKRFGEAESPGFVNGVLDAVKRRLREDGATTSRPDGGR